MNAITIQNFEAVKVEIHPDALRCQAEAIGLSKNVLIVRDHTSQQTAVDAMSAVKKVLKTLENSRTTVKRPILEMGKTIDDLAKKFGKELEGEFARVQALVVGYEAEKRRIAAEKEAALQAELRRVEEERQAVEREAARKQAEAEAAIAKMRNAKAREAAEAALAAQKAADMAKQDALKNELAEINSLPAAPVHKAEGTVVREVFVFEVTDIHALYAHNREYVRTEVNREMVNAAIKNGMRECPGLIITKEVKVGVRS